MTSKWKWISSKLKDILHHDSFNLPEKALEIDRALESIYGYTTTPYFKEKEEEIEERYNKLNNRKDKLKHIDGVVRSVLYCVACYEHKRNCNSCEFAKKYGDCDENDSLFGGFYSAFSYHLQY